MFTRSAGPPRYSPCTTSRFIGGDRTEGEHVHEQAAARPRRGVWCKEAGWRVLQHGADLPAAVVAARAFPNLPIGSVPVRFELFEGSDWRGDYATRRAAMADAELIAAKHGCCVTWTSSGRGATTGRPAPAGDSAEFSIRPRARPTA